MMRSVLLRAGLWWGLTVIMVLAYVGWALPNAHWSSNIAAAMPGTGAAWQQQLVQQNNSSRHVSLLLSGLTLKELQQAASQLQQQNIPALQWLQPGQQLQQLQQLYQQHQSLLVSQTQLQLLRSGQYQGLIDAAWQRLYSPAPLLAGALQQDPLLLTQQYLEQQQPQPGKQLRQHWLELSIEQQPALLLYATLQTDPFDRNNASITAKALEQQLTQLQQQWPQLTMARSGVLFHAVVASRNASFEMQVFGGLSLCAILALLWWSFASWRPLLFAVLTLSCATLFGLAAVLLCFEQPHVLGLVFATTLIGIAVDYSVHGMLAAVKGKRAFHRMLPSLLLGLFTTVLGYLALTLLPFAILNQVAVFMCAGLIAAFITVRLVFLPGLANAALQVNPRLSRLCQAISRLYQRINGRALLISASVMLLLVSALLYQQLQFSDDVRLFNQSPAALLQQEQQVRQAGGQNWDSRFIVVLAVDEEQLLQRQQALIPLLADWQQQGKLAAWQASVQQVPPLALQDNVQQLLQQAYQSPPLQAYLQQLQLAAPPPLMQRLRLEQLSAGGLSLVQQLPEQLAGIILLRQVQLAPEDIAQLTQSGHSFYLDPVADTNHSLLQLRAELSRWLVLALCCAIVLLSWRRGMRVAAAILLMLSLAIGTALLLSVWWQQQLNIFNLIAALLVLALALDYGIFFTARLPQAEVIQAVLLSATTSCLAFGLLGFSSTPAIASFGLTVFLGVALAALLAPALDKVVNKESDKRAAL